MWGLNLAELGLISGTIATLVFLEGLLSADNALVLAVMVRHLPKDEQKRALRYGIIGAFGFRLIAVIFASALLEYWSFKVVGGVYLLYLAIAHLLFGEEESDGNKKSRFGSGFWGTVIGVEIADIAFSIDSIVAAVAMAGGIPAEVASRTAFRLGNFDFTMKLFIVYLGGILGIVAMRFVAGYFLILLDRFTALATGAYYLVAWIGLKLVGSGFHDALHPDLKKGPAPSWHTKVPGWAFDLPLEMNPWVFWAGMALIVAASLAYRPRKSAAESKQITEEEFLT